MSQIMAPFQLLELNVISAQDLAAVGRNMRTYAVAWVHPDRKLSTRVDTQGHRGPTWNDKFVFRVDEEFLYSDESAIMIEIYALHWFRDIHVGTVRVLVGNLIPPPSRPFHNNRPSLGMRFVALQVRRPSGRPQGILNVGVAVLDSSMRSMPLYTLNPSAVGYRHLMGEKDAYDTHNHLSPNVFHHQAPRPELRRTKSDTSSIIASEAVARKQRAIINKGKANSVISGSEVSVKKKKKGKKKSKSPSSVLSGVSAKSGKATHSVLSDTVLPWKVKNGKNSSAPAVDNVHVEPLLPPVHNDVVEGDDAHSIVNTVSEAATTEINANTTQEHVPVNNVAYEVSASPRPHYRNSPAPAQFRNSPAPQFKNSPAPQFKNSPAPQFKNSPAPHYKNSPAPHYKNSPAPHYKNSPAPQYMSSPAPQYMNSPAPQYMNSSAPQYMNSPARQYVNSPKPQYVNSPKPQYVNSPKPQYVNSPKPQFMTSPKPQFVNSPMPQFRNSPAVVPPQFRNSPAVSKFNPAVGYGGSHRGTPMHPFGKFEYATPRRSNLGNMGPVVMTESELGPSPSEVAAEMARKPVIDEGDNSTVGGWSLDDSVEGLQSKLERWRTELPPVIDRGELSSHPTSSTKTSRHSRRHTDGGNGLFSCFSNICGLQCTIVCGGDPKGKKKQRHRTPSVEVASSM